MTSLTKRNLLSELMIGNYVIHEEEKQGVIFTAYNISKFAEHLNGHPTPRYYKTITPIKIATLWLHTLGFESFGDGTYEHDISVEKIRDNEHRRTFIFFSTNTNMCSLILRYYDTKEGLNTEHAIDLAHIEYVHQLQNLIKLLVNGRDRTFDS